MSADPNALDQALAALPHGPEFRFLDRISELEPGRRGVGEFTVRESAYYLRGHFPGNPLLPGVLLVEAAAQLLGTVAQSDTTHPPWPQLKLAALQSVKFFGSAKPGETVRLEAWVDARLGPLIQGRAEARVDGRSILQASITLGGAE